MPRRHKRKRKGREWNWNDFAKAIGGGVVAGFVGETVSAGGTGGLFVIGCATGGAALYAFDWVWDNITRGKSG
jgi:hypothetical protein